MAGISEGAVTTTNGQRPRGLDSFLAAAPGPKIRTMSAGDPHSELARLYPPLAPALHAWACLRLRPEDRPHLPPEDLTQEVWLRAFQVFHTFNSSRTSFRAWLFAVAKNVLLEVRRRARRSQAEQAAHGSSSRLSALEQVPLEVTSVTRRVAKDEDLQRFVARLRELDETERQTVLHCGLEALSLKEAATRLGESYDATAKRWQRLRDRMRTWGAPLGLVAEA
jgi:RNA polymerase sigma factor (sigma-70 family)